MHVDLSLKKQLEAKYSNEQVFAVPFAETLHINDKFTKTSACISCLRTWDHKGRYILRSDAEYNQSLQQLIPYVIIVNVAGSKYYVSKRIAGDERLKNTFSLGFGGHINPIDGTSGVIMASLERELNEEVFIKRAKTPVNFMGYVRDLNSETKEHLGFVFEVQALSVKIKEDTVLEGYWMSLQDMVDNYHQFESWARHIIDYLFVLHQKKPA